MALLTCLVPRHGWQKGAGFLFLFMLSQSLSTQSFLLCSLIFYKAAQGSRRKCLKRQEMGPSSLIAWPIYWLASFLPDFFGQSRHRICPDSGIEEKSHLLLGIRLKNLGHLPHGTLCFLAQNPLTRLTPSLSSNLPKISVPYIKIPHYTYQKQNLPKVFIMIIPFLLTSDF